VRFNSLCPNRNASAVSCEAGLWRSIKSESLGSLCISMKVTVYALRTSSRASLWISSLTAVCGERLMCTLRERTRVQPDGDRVDGMNDRHTIIIVSVLEERYSLRPIWELPPRRTQDS
jgi:hypothetical protein